MALKLVEFAVYELLKGLAGGAVYAQMAPKGAQGPFIIFQRINSERVRHINGPSRLPTAEMQIDAYAEDYYDCKELGAQIEEILDGFKGIVPYGTDSPRPSVEIAGTTLENDVDIFDQTDEPYMHRSSAVYRITYRQ